jgi:hypothetical protein
VVAPGKHIFKTRMKKLRSLQEPSGRRLAGFVLQGGSKPSNDHQEQARTLLHANHLWPKYLFDDPKGLLAVELGL